MKVRKIIESSEENIKNLENETQEETITEDFDSMYEKLFGKKPIIQTQENTEMPKIEEKPNVITYDLKKENISVFEDKEESKKTLYKFIGIVFNTYIILEIDKEMYILDQHAAHERIM